MIFMCRYLTSKIKQFQFGPVKIHVWFTTGNVRTEMNHPSRGRDPLHRQFKFASLMDLKKVLIKPRIHTNVGYRSREVKKIPTPQHPIVIRK